MSCVNSILCCGQYLKQKYASVLCHHLFFVGNIFAVKGKWEWIISV